MLIKLFSPLKSYLTFNTGNNNIPIFLTSGFMVFLCVFVHWRATHTRVQFTGAIDLSNDWNACIGNECNWTPLRDLNTQIVMPAQNIRSTVSIYKVNFGTPPVCLESRGCEFFIGGVYQGIETFINGQSLGIHFTRGDLYPARFKIPMSILKMDSSPNELKIKILPTENGNAPSITQGPIGIVSSFEGDRMAESIIGERVALPMMSALSTLTFGLISLFWMLSKKSNFQLLKRYFLFCIASAAYMINATRIPREYFPYSFGMSVNYGLRFTMDLALFDLVVAYFLISRKYIAVMRKLYWAPIFIFVFIAIITAIYPGSKFFATNPFASSLAIGGLRSGDSVYLIACFFLILMPLAPMIGLVLSLRRFRSEPDLLALISLFLVLFPMEVLDFLTFIGAIHRDHEIYYMRLYTPFIGLSFGYVIWKKWLQMEKSDEAKLRIGEISSAVAHDLRSPIAALNIVNQLAVNLEDDEKTLLNSAVERISRIANDLLNKYKEADSATTRSGSSVREVISSTVNQKILISDEAGQLNIKIADEIGPDGTDRANIDPSDLNRIVDNILNNAIDSTEGRRDKLITVRVFGQKHYIQIEISDNGVGMDENLARSFNNGIFGQTTRSGGHGIGLGSSFRTLQRCRGQISFRRGMNHGTVVTISLPVSTDIT